MRVNTIFKYHFPFEYWTLQADTNGATVYAKTADKVGMYIPGGGTSGHLVCAEQLDILMQVRGIVDRNGTPLFNFPMFVLSVEPQMDPFSNVIAYRHRLSREAPRDYDQLIQNIMDEV